MAELKEIGAYDSERAQIAKVKDYCNFLPDVTTSEGYEKSKRVSLDVGKILTSVEARRKQLKSDSIKTGQAIDSEAKTIVEELAGLQLPHKAAYKELDNLKKEAEANRKASLEQRIEDMRGLPVFLANETSDTICDAMDGVVENLCLDYDEYNNQAVKVRSDTIKALEELFNLKMNAEKDAAELVVLRDAAAAQKLINDEARIRLEANEQAQEKIDAAEKNARDAAQAIKQAEIDKEAAAKAAATAVTEAKELSDTLIRDAAQKAAQEQIEKTRREAKEAADIIDARERNKRHVGAMRKAAKESIMALGFNDGDAKKLVMAIHAGEIENIVINY